MDDPEDDPWNSPDVHKNPSHPKTNGVGSHDANTNGHSNAFGDTPSPLIAGRTISQHAVNETPSSNAGQQSVSSAGQTQPGGWGGYFDGSGAGAGPGFNQAGQDSGASPFGAGGLSSDGPGRQPEHNPLAPPPARVSNARSSVGVEEKILVALMPEKEGVFMFQHHNYEVTSHRRGSKVIRRYSDFVWLLDCLHKRYPFRVLPLLPPKRVAVNGNHLSNDGSFIEKRRRGLARFLNALVRHPVLSQEQLVVMFLTVPTVSSHIRCI